MDPPCSVRFQFMSDLHLEFHTCGDGFESLLRPIAPYLILAGDIGNVSPVAQYDKLKSFLHKCTSLWKVVVYVPGNHEYYGVSIKQGNELLAQLAHEVNLDHKGSPLRVLNPGTIVIDDIPIVGGTLWSHIPHREKAISKRGIADFVQIEEHGVDDHNKLFETESRILRKLHKNSNRKCIVVSHHCPSRFMARLPTRAWCEADLSAAFGTDNLLDLFDSNKIHCWIYGHTHQNREAVVDSISLKCNQKGTFEQNRSFDVTKTIEIIREQ